MSTTGAVRSRIAMECVPKPLRALHRRVQRLWRSKQGVPDNWPSMAPLDVRPRASELSELRLNLVIGSVDPTTAYGGVETALRLFESLVETASCRSRVVCLDGIPNGLDQVAGHRRARAGDEALPRSLVGIGRGEAGRLPVGPRDAFVATYWSTASFVREIREWQRITYGDSPSYYAYIIQDYEPGFFPYSADYMRAYATYQQPHETIAIFNTSLLGEHFANRGLRFAHEFAFEPRLPGALRGVLASPRPRSRRIVVYGRPRKPRNGFPLIVDGLRAWHDVDPRAGTWECVSAGQPHNPVDLGGGALRSLGKLDMASYGNLLKTSAIGLSLMLSPHPSYPPLEMAHLGMLVLTNRFREKDLSSWHDNILSLGSVGRDDIALALTEACARFEADPTIGDRGESGRPEYLSHAGQFPFLRDVARLLMDCY